MPSGVTDISFINPTSNSVKVIWKPPVKLNGKIGYYLLYWRTSVADSVIGRWMFSGGVTSKLVTGLKPYVHYTFSVIPYNLRKSLHGPPSNNSITTEAAGRNTARAYHFSLLFFIHLLECASEESGSVPRHICLIYNFFVL